MSVRQALDLTAIRAMATVALAHKVARRQRERELQGLDDRDRDVKMTGKKDHEYGIGERTDGTVDTFPLSELPARLAEWRAQQAAEDEPDELSDLGDVEKLFKPEEKPAGDDTRDLEAETFGAAR